MKLFFSQLYPIGFLLFIGSCSQQEEPKLVTPTVDFSKASSVSYDGPQDNSPSTIPIGTYSFAVKLTPDVLTGLAGKKMIGVRFFKAGEIQNIVINLLEVNDENKPGKLILQQPFTVKGTGWYNVPLEQKLPLPGTGVWISIDFQKPGANDLTIGCDAGPAKPHGEYILYQGVWTKYSRIRSASENRNIKLWLE